MNNQTLLIRKIARLFGCVFALFSSVSVATPLNPQQQQNALELISDLSWPADEARAPQVIGPSQTHPLGLQTVSIEREVIKNSTQADQVRVYQFNYATDSARVVSVSLTEQAVIKQALIKSVHLPLTSAEQAHAIELLSANSDAITLLQADQQRRGRTPFSNINELSVKSSIYKPLNKTHRCAEERCALLSLFDSSNTVFAAEPIVNLSHGAIVWLNR